MTNTDKVAYSVLYANVQRNSYANASLNAIGERAWKKVFKNDLDEPMAPPVAVLARGTYIGVQVNPYFLIYRNGKFSNWFYSRPVSVGISIFLNDFYLVIKKSGLDNYYDYNNSIVRDDVPPIGLIDWWYPHLVFPYKDGILFANQFTGGPQRAPKEFVFGYKKYGNNISEWYYGEKGEISDVLLNSTIDKLVFVFRNRINILDPATGKKVKVFDPELPSIFEASLDLSNNIVIHAMNKEQKEVYVSFDLNGTRLWEHEVIGKVRNDQPPVCGEDGTVYYIADSSLVCIKEGNEVWKSELFPCVNPLMTNSKGNNVIVQSGFHIMAYDSDGNMKFKTLITKNMNEEFTAPPVIGGDGLIYTASGTALYCFK